jgi:hypothetical protein
MGVMRYVQEIIAQRGDSLMRGCYAPSCIVVILAPYGFIIALWLGQFYWALSWTVAFLLFGWWLGARLQRHSDHIYAGLKRSCFMQRLAAGPQELEMIYDGVPAIAALFLIGPKPHDLHGWARLVVQHIDYYALPEQSATTRVLQSLLYMAMPPAVSYAGGVLMANQEHIWFISIAGALLALVALILVIVHDRAMRAASVDALRRYLDKELMEEML